MSVLINTLGDQKFVKYYYNIRTSQRTGPTRDVSQTYVPSTREKDEQGPGINLFPLKYSFLLKKSSFSHIGWMFVTCTHLKVSVQYHAQACMRQVLRQTYSEKRHVEIKNPFLSMITSDAKVGWNFILHRVDWLVGRILF